MKSDLIFPMQGMQVLTSVGDLRSLLPHSQKTKA